MSNAKVFDKIILKMLLPFSQEQLTETLETDSNWTGSSYYVKSCINDRVKRKVLLKNSDNTYVTVGWRKIISDFLSENEGQRKSEIKKHLVDNQLRVARVNDMLQIMIQERSIFQGGNDKYYSSEQIAKRDVSDHRKLSPCPFETLELSQEDSLKFVIFTVKTFWDLCKKNNIQEVSRYYSSTDQILLKDDSLTDIQFIFKQIAFHATNRQNSPFVFKDCENAVKEFTKGYNSQKFYNYYNQTGLDKKQMIYDFAESCGKAIKPMDTDAEDQKNKKYIKFTRFVEYVNCLADAAFFLLDKTSKNEVIDAFNVTNGTINEIFNRFVSEIRHGYGIPLTFDFLKELDSDVFDYPKPDLHVKRTMMLLLNSRDMTPFSGGNYARFNANTSLDSFYTMELYMDVIKKANAELQKHCRSKTIPNYLIDKFIYIIGSGKFYLDGQTRNSSKKIQYLDSLIYKRFRNIEFNVSNINLIKELFVQLEVKKVN